MCERTLRGGGGGGDGGGGFRSWRHNMETLLLCLLMLISGTLAPRVAEAAELTCDQDAPATYTAAVVEYSPELGVTEENVVQRFKDNINAYKEFINAAKKEGADIIVFPECGLATLELPRLGDGSPAVSVDVSNIGTNPCIEEDIFHQQEMRDLSCAAREAGVYVVVNLPEEENCSPALAFCPECPGFDRSSVPSGVVACTMKGFRYFNTDVAFDRQGTVIARYRKFNLFGEPGFVAPAKVELSTFMTDFGVRFGIFTCFDLMFERPAVELVAEAGITDLIFPTAWFSELPFLTAIQAQAAWSWVLDVNMLAAGYNLPSVGSTGTGLFAGRRGVVSATMERTRTSKMLVGKMPNARSCKKSDQNVTLTARTITLQAYEVGVGLNNFLGGQKPPKMKFAKRARELPKRKVSIPSLYKCHLKSLLQMDEERHIVRTDTGEATSDENNDKKVQVMYKRKEDVDADDEQELLADEEEFREALAPRPDGNSKLIQGHRYRKYLKDLMLARLKDKYDKVVGGGSEVKRKERPENVKENSDNTETDTKRYKKRRKPLDFDDFILGTRKLQQKSEKKKKEEDDGPEPSIEEIASTMLSGLEEGGDQGEQVKDMVEKLQEDQEKYQLAAKPTPSIDEMEGTLLDALKELSGNMTAEEEILSDVMMDLQDSDQREAVERKFILERCQRILMEIIEPDETDSGVSDSDSDDGEALRILTEEPLADGSLDSNSSSIDEDKKNNTAKVDVTQSLIKRQSKDKTAKKDKTPETPKPKDLKKTVELKTAKIVAPKPDDNILPKDDDTGASEEETLKPIEETLVPDTPPMEGPIEEKLKASDVVVPKPDDSILPKDDDTGASEEETKKPIEETLVPDTPPMEGIIEDKIPSEEDEGVREGDETKEEEGMHENEVAQEDEGPQEREEKHEEEETGVDDGPQELEGETTEEEEGAEEDEGTEVEECDDETCTSRDEEGAVPSSTEISMPHSTDLKQHTPEPVEPLETPCTDKPPSEQKTTLEDKKSKFSSDITRKQSTTKEKESECSNYVTPEKIKVSKSSFGAEKASGQTDAFLYLKTEDLRHYASLLLTTQSITENSTVTVCHGTFCCYFSVTIHSSLLPSHTGYKPTSHGVSALREGLIPLVKDEWNFYAQKPGELRNLRGLDSPEGEQYEEEDFPTDDDDKNAEDDDDDDDDDDGDDDDSELSDIDLSEMTPDEVDEDDSDIIDREIHEGPVFLQSAVLQNLQAGEMMGVGSLTQADMEPSEKIIEEEKKVKEREEKAISDGLVEEVAPHIPVPEMLKKEEIEVALEKEKKEGHQMQSTEVKKLSKEVKKQEKAVKEMVDKSDEEPSAQVQDEVARREEIPTELAEEAPSEEEEVGEEVEPSGDFGRDVKLKEEDVAPKKVEQVSQSRVCDCVDCWEGKDEALEERAEEPETQEMVGDVEGVEKESETDKQVDMKDFKRYYYRLVVYNGLRSFDGIADGGLQVCAVISCTGMSLDTCGKLHNEGDKVIPINFDQVAIRGNFRRNRALPMPTTLGMDMMPLPARSFSLKVAPRRGHEAEVLMQTSGEASFLTFGIYSRDFERDPEKSQNIA